MLYRLEAAPPLGSHQSSCWRERLNGLLTLARGGEPGRWRESGPSVSSILKDPVKAFAAGLALMLACAGLSACNDASGESATSGSAAHRTVDQSITVQVRREIPYLALLVRLRPQTDEDGGNEERTCTPVVAV